MNEYRRNEYMLVGVDEDDLSWTPVLLPMIGGAMEAQDLSNEDFARRGNAIFKERVKPHVDVNEEAHKFVAIDIMTGEHEVDKSEVEATDRLVERDPEAAGRIWLRRVGSSETYHFGSCLLTTLPK